MHVTVVALLIIQIYWLYLFEGLCLPLKLVRCSFDWSRKFLQCIYISHCNLRISFRIMYREYLKYYATMLDYLMYQMKCLSRKIEMNRKVLWKIQYVDTCKNSDEKIMPAAKIFLRCALDGALLVCTRMEKLSSRKIRKYFEKWRFQFLKGGYFKCKSYVILQNQHLRIEFVESSLFKSLLCIVNECICILIFLNFLNKI